MLNLYLRGRHYLYYLEQQKILNFAPEEVLSLSSNAVCYTNIYEKMVQGKQS